MHLIHRFVQEASSRPESEQIPLRVDRSQFLKRRWRTTAVDGTEFGFDLIDRLHSGAVIHQEAGLDYVILQNAETVYELRWPDAPGAALAGWKLGNLHLPVEVGPGWLRILHDPSVAQLGARENWALEEKTVLFRPMRVVPHGT